MFSRINFTYKKPAQDSKSYLILREQLVKQKIRENEKKSLINCISLQNKVDSKKVQNTSNTFEQSREKIGNNDVNNTNFEIKLNTVYNLNTEMLDSVFEDKIILTDEQLYDIQENIKNSQTSLYTKADPNKLQNTNNTFEQSREKIDYHDDNNTRFVIKLNDVYNFNTEMIDSVFEDKIILTDKQIHDIQQNIKNSQTGLYTKADPNKLQNTNNIFEQSREKIDYHDDNNTRFVIKLNDVYNLNTEMIDNVEDKIILTDEQIYEKMKIQEEIINSKTSLYNKADPNKLQNTRDIFEQSREKLIIKNRNSTDIENEERDKNSQTSLHIKVDKNKLPTTKDIFEQSLEKIYDNDSDNYDNYDNNIVIKLKDVSNIKNEMIDSVFENKIMLTDEQHIELQETQNKIIVDLGKVIKEGSFDFEAATTFIENAFDNSSEIDDNTPLPFNVDRIHKKGIKFFNHVYQSKYEYGKENGTGLGDFLRGCYFILEFCETYNFQSKIIFNNCISKFLLIKTHDLERFDNVLKGISICRNNNFREYVVENNCIINDVLKDTKNIMADFVDYVVKLPQYSGNVFMYCIAFPINEIPEKNKQHMRKFLEPTNEMQLTINQTLDDLNITSKQYIVIHIRAGDSYLKEENDSFTNGYIRTLINNIKNDINRDNNYLLMADNNDVKKIIHKFFPNFKILMNPITHFGEGVVLEEEKVKNTLIDFYLLSRSKSIFSYSAYKHGSGFSYWCAKTFNIPYVCKHVK